MLSRAASLKRRRMMNKKHKDEVRERWGETDAYREYFQKCGTKSDEEKRLAQKELDSVFADFADCMNDGDVPASLRSQKLVEKLRDCITVNYYTCTQDILLGLGELYVTDGRFKKNIDRHSEGTANFVSSAIIAFSEEAKY